ncbi:thioredoxin-like protein [Trametes gibbosa]|nr:thioredoxin-like protein [Trametes gibbosa]UVJ47689.1 glutathion S-transferase 6 [Trametes gibbosa]
MAPTGQLTFYTAKYSPFAQRVHIALEEAKAEYTLWEFEVRGSKPEWYKQVNPLAKIPALTIGGPVVPPDQPSTESTKLYESIAILEFIADVYPEANLRPANPILRAKGRTFVEIYRNYVNEPFIDAFFRGKSVENVIQALERLQAALPPAGFAAGEWSIADIAVAPFLTRMYLFMDRELGAYTREDWLKVRDSLDGEKFSRLKQYVQDIHGRPSFAKTWGSNNLQIELWKDHPGLRGKLVASN